MKDQVQILTLSELKAHALSFLEKYPHGCRLGLKGDLGAGKTTWVRYVIEALNEGQPQRVTSPSFTLHCSYHLTKGFVEHFDFYRLENAEESDLMDIGYFSALEKTQSLPNGFLFVEWPEKAKHLNQLSLELILTIDVEDEVRTLSLAIPGKP